MSSRDTAAKGRSSVHARRSDASPPCGRDRRPQRDGRRESHETRQPGATIDSRCIQSYHGLGSLLPPLANMTRHLLPNLMLRTCTGASAFHSSTVGGCLCTLLALPPPRVQHN